MAPRMTCNPDGFEIFWQLWCKTARHTDGRGKCREPYQKQLNMGATPEDILLAAAWHVRATKDIAFIPLASSWLAAEKWRDEADKERQYQAKLADRATNVVPIKPVSTYKPKFLRDWDDRQKQGLAE